jgi:hypothetical protein
MNNRTSLNAVVSPDRAAFIDGLSMPELYQHLQTVSHLVRTLAERGQALSARPATAETQIRQEEILLIREPLQAEYEYAALRLSTVLPNIPPHLALSQMGHLSTH